MDIKDGWKSSEFWVTLVIVGKMLGVDTALTSDQALSTAEQVQKISDILKGVPDGQESGIFILLGIYITGRILIKLFEIKYSVRSTSAPRVEE